MNFSKRIRIEQPSTFGRNSTLPVALFMHVENQKQEEAVSSPNPRSQPYVQQRRSQRILLSIPIVVSGRQANGTAFSERAKTQVVNAHGAAIQLRIPVLSGQELRIKNVATNEEITCTVADINPGTTEVPEVGIAFAKPCPSFWRVAFPPEDWSPHSPEAKRVSPITMLGKPTLVRK